ENFLRVVESSIYGNPHSAYLALLKFAGCELGDVRALVHANGNEGALKALRAAGVYVTFEEFKGRTPLVRHGKTIPLTWRSFQNPYMKASFSVESGGSSGTATRVLHDLSALAARAPHNLLGMSAHGVLGAP